MKNIALIVAVLSFLCIQPVVQVSAGNSTLTNPQIQQTISPPAPQRESFTLVLDKARKGDAKSQFSLGLMYAKGEGVAQNKKKAVEWCIKSAVQGYVEAQYNLGILYANGDSVEKDMRKAVNWYTKAAEQGHAEAQLNLGLCYMTGDGIEINRILAHKWWVKSASQGNKTAQENLDLLCKQSPTVCK
jgi:uncharacterized protein